MKTQKVNEVLLPDSEITGEASSTKMALVLRWIPRVAMAATLFSCNNTDQLVQRYKMLHDHDSLLAIQTQADDSTIKGYIQAVNDIQSNIDQITSREKIIAVHDENVNTPGANTVADIKALDNLILSGKRQIASLQTKMKKMNKKDAEMETMLDHFKSNLTEKDSEIASLRNTLASDNDAYKEITRQFNDSVAVIQQQTVKIENITNEMNTVYYAVGTLKELKKNNVIDKTGGVAFVGRNAEIKPDFNAAYFTKSDLTKLDVIPLNAKFKKLLSNHPMESYKITGNKASDSLVITDHSSFWSENRYLVVAVK